MPRVRPSNPDSRDALPARRRRSCSILVALLITLSFGCASSHHAGVDNSVRLRVENQQFDAVTVVLVRGASALPIGFVQGFSTRTFRLPAGYLGSGLDVSLRAEPRMARNAQQSLQFHVQPGQTVTWSIRPAEAMSALMVR